jgi:hypothetical protein
MGSELGTEQPFSSTTWEWRRVKIRRPAGGQKAPQPKAGRWHRFPARDPRVPLTLTVKFRGGPECWYEVHARGSAGRFIGTTSIHDVMAEINRQL